MHQVLRRDVPRRDVFLPDVRPVLRQDVPRRDVRLQDVHQVLLRDVPHPDVRPVLRQVCAEVCG